MQHLAVWEKNVVFLNYTKVFDIDLNNLNELGMSKSLPYVDIKFDKTVSFEKKPAPPENADTGYVWEVDLNYTDTAKYPLWTFHFVRTIKNYQFSFIRSIRKSTNLKTYSPPKKLICDHADKKNFPQYTHLKFLLAQR